MNVYWLEQTAADLPSDNQWLSARELAQLESMRFPKRRADWQLGRWTAKCSVAACLQLPIDRLSLTRIELRPAPSGAPEVFYVDKPVPITVSLSHSAGIAACAVTLCCGALGCDVETIEPHSEAFVRDYFTSEEQELVEQAPEKDHPLLSTLLWSAKESALKALRTGLRLDTRCLIVTLDGTLHSAESATRETVHNCVGNNGNHARSAQTIRGWQPLCVRRVQGQTFRGWWRHDHAVVRTMVAAPAPQPPAALMPNFSLGGGESIHHS